MSGMPGITAPQRRSSASRLALGALSSAVPCARAHTTAILAMWGLTRVADSAELVVCELVTNAITHGSGGTGGRGLIPVVHLDLSTDLARLRVDVWDTSPRAPVLTPDVPDSAEGGRGLLVVDALCETWGADRVPGWPGKVVRAVLAIPEEPHEKPGIP